MQRDVYEAEVLVLGNSREELESRYAPYAGAISGIVSAFVTHPLDVVKTRLQACSLQMVQIGRPRSQSLKYFGTFQALSLIWKEEGLRGLWQGINPTIVGLIPTQAIFFAVYTSMKTSINSSELLFFKQWLPAWSNSPVATNASSAAIAWLVTSVLTNPLWVVKVRMQVQKYSSNQTRRYDGLFRSWKIIVKEEGVRGLYRGTSAAMLGALGAMVQFPIYEAIKNQRTTSDTLPSFPRIAVASALSSLLSSMTVYPFEVVRSRIQVQDSQTKNGYRGIVDCMRRMLGNEGFFAFYKGMGTNLIRTVPNGIIALSSYEMGLRLVHHLFLYWQTIYHR
eukprot:jgi/Galph1/2997/GphlegSOOS_G1670.1